MRRAEAWDGVTLLGHGLVLVLLIVPLFAVLRASVVDPATGDLTLSRFARILGEPYYRDAVVNSLKVASGAALGAVLLGLPLALLTARYALPARTLLTTLAVLALLSPPFVGAYAWVLLLGKAGALRAALAALGLEVPALKGPAAIAFVLALQYYPFVFLLTSSALASVDRALEEAAESLGAGPWLRLRRVVLPLVLPSLSAGALLAFMMALANFGTPVVLDAGTRVLPTLCYDRFTSEVSSDLGLPSALCVVLVLLSTVALLLQRWAASRRRVAADLLRRPRARELPPGPRALATAVCWGIVLLSTVPLAVVVWTSVRATDGPVFQPGLSLDSYRQVLHGVPRAIGNSFVYSVTAALLIALAGAALGYVIARRRGGAARALDPLLMVPYVVPGVAIGIAYVLAWNDGPLVLTGTGTIIVLASFVRHLPYTVRSTAAALQQVDPALEEAALSLGASPARTFADVTLPLIAPGVLAGTALAWVTAVGELSATLILYTGDTVTMPVKIYLQVIDGSLGPAAALSTLLLLATGAALFTALRALGGKAEALAT